MSFLKGAWAGATEPYDRAGEAGKPWEATSRLGLDVASFFVGAGEAKAGVTAAKAGTVVNDLDRAGTVANEIYHPSDIGLSDRGYYPPPGERSMTREQWQAQDRTGRARGTVARADQPLEPINPNKATHGHGHADHGNQTTAGQQGDRIRMGLTPSGRMGAPVSKVSHFGSPEAEAEALG